MSSYQKHIESALSIGKSVGPSEWNYFNINIDDNFFFREKYKVTFSLNLLVYEKDLKPNRAYLSVVIKLFVGV